MAQIITKAEIKKMLDDEDNSYNNGNPNIVGDGERVAKLFIDKIHRRIHYILDHYDGKGGWEEKVQMFPERTEVDYLVGFRFNHETGEIGFYNSSYQKAIMVPFIDCGLYE